MSTSKKIGICPICTRENQQLTFHHTIPKTLHSTKYYKKNFTKEQMDAGIFICRLCHNNIHNFISEKEMGREYNTLEKLLSHEKVINYIPFAKKQK
jgi:hypothetical protein